MDHGRQGMRRAFTLVLDDLTAQKLRQLAEQERRRPSDQAAIYVERAIAGRGAHETVPAGRRARGAA